MGGFPCLFGIFSRNLSQNSHSPISVNSCRERGGIVERAVEAMKEKGKLGGCLQKKSPNS